MSTSDSFVNIADANHPNAGRIYDYLLGGNHNFEIDRQAAEGLLKLIPFMPKFVRLIRWFLGEAVRRLSKEGYTVFIDFASGLPTMDHIHQIVAPGTKVVYSDIDPVTVAYGKDIIGDTPNVQFLHCDAGKPEELLSSDAVKQMVGESRKVAIGYNGIAWFMPDDKIANFMKVTYEWAERGSKLFLCDVDASGSATGVYAQMTAMYKNLKQPVFDRPNQKLAQLIQPWEIVEPGFKRLEEWVGVEKGVQKEASDQVRTGAGELMGGILLKK